MSSARPAIRRARLTILAALGTVMLIGAYAPTAGAATLAGPWAPFGNCPVDDPVMLETPATIFGSICASTVSTSGSFKIGDTVVETARTEMQFGLAGSGDVAIPASDGKTLAADPVQVPGGLLGIVPPEQLKPLLDPLNPILGVKATVELAGPITEFNAAGVFAPGDPIINLPVKVHLENPVLGADCYIGSNDDPIVLRPATITAGTPSSASDPNLSGFFVTFAGGSIGDDTFAVPGADGCGPAGLLDPLVDQQVGLPSPSGRNALVLDDVTAAVVITQQGGQELADAWHASELP